MGILELTCPLDSEHHLESARDWKQNKTEYVQILAELDRLNVSHCYSTIEISVQGHFQPHSIKAIKDVTSFVSDQALSTATVRSFLIDMARASICASERIFFGRNCKEWTVNPD